MQHLCIILLDGINKTKVLLDELIEIEYSCKIYYITLLILEIDIRYYYISCYGLIAFALDIYNF